MTHKPTLIRYSLLEKCGAREKIDPFITLWSLKVLPSAQVFAWRALLNKIATNHNLASRLV